MPGAFGLRSRRARTVVPDLTDHPVTSEGNHKWSTSLHGYINRLATHISLTMAHELRAAVAPRVVCGDDPKRLLGVLTPHDLLTR